MKDWIGGFQASIDYMEQNLPDAPNIEKNPADTVTYICEKAVTGQGTMKKLLAVLIMTVLTFGAVMPLPADAADLDSVLHDAAWAEYVERSIDLDKAPGLAAAAVSGPEVGFRNRGFADKKAQTTKQWLCSRKMRS